MNGNNNGNDGDEMDRSICTDDLSIDRTQIPIQHKNHRKGIHRLYTNYYIILY
jgi:hypothetical protein